MIGTGPRAVGQGYTYGDSTKQKFTGYERDEETNLDFAQARMYSSQLGRFSVADPLLSSATIKSPQSWNRYSYVYNNPTIYIDPYGLYVWGKGFGAGKDDDDLTKEERKKRKEFKESLEKAQIVAALMLISDDPTIRARGRKIQRAVDSYGEEGIDNGVTLQIGKVDKKSNASVTFGNPLGIRADSNNNLVADVVVTFSEKNNIEAVTVVHEGSHVADWLDLSDVILSNPSFATEKDLLNSPKNITTYETENSAYFVGSYVAESLGQNYNANGIEYWNEGWKASERETKRANGISKILEKSYGVTKDKQGDSLVKVKK
ncbi:MAG: RHS repeat-associated core domain-containing protein [Pyrinomonadaceae bacterium]